jgi:hypothetical protein
LSGTLVRLRTEFGVVYRSRTWIDEVLPIFGARVTDATLMRDVLAIAALDAGALRADVSGLTCRTTGRRSSSRRETCAVRWSDCSPTATPRPIGGRSDSRIRRRGLPGEARRSATGPAASSRCGQQVVVDRCVSDSWDVRRLRVDQCFVCRVEKVLELDGSPLFFAPVHMTSAAVHVAQSDLLKIGDRNDRPPRSLMPSC